jgi:hypothetical protein
MTQNQAGRAQGNGAPQAEQSGPMTRLKQAASALRGDQADQPVPGQAASTSPDMPDPNGSWPARPGQADAVSTPAPEDEMVAGEYADATRRDDVDAVPSPDAADRDYRDDETAPEGDAIASDPSMTGASTYGTTVPAGSSGTAPGRQEPSGIGLDATADGTPEVGPAGRHAAAGDAGLRPGEATDRLGDFGDIAFGNLLPDAAQYTAQWEQIQFRFVDDPEGSVTRAADIASQLTTRLEAAIQERQRAIQERQRAIQERASALRGRWGEGSNADTEMLRETLRMYRAFIDQLVRPAS